MHAERAPTLPRTRYFFTRKSPYFPPRIARELDYIYPLSVITSSNNCFLQNLSILIQDSNVSIMIILIVKIIVRIVRGPRFYRRLLLIDLLGYVNNCTIKGKARDSGASLLRIRSVHNRSHPPINSSLMYTHTYIYRLIEKDPRFSKLCRPRKWATLQRHGEQTMI